MDRFSAFFTAVAKSCYDMEYYRAVRNHPHGTRRAFAYVAGLYGMFALLGALVFVPSAIALRGKFESHVASVIPSGATFMMEKGELFSNVQMPLALGTPEFPIALDTGVALEDEDDLTADGVVFGRDGALLVQGEKREAVPYKDIPNFTVSREQLVHAVTSFGPFMAAGVAVFITLMWAIGSLIGGTLQALLVAFVAWVATRGAKRKLAYGQWFSSMLHALTLPALLSVLFGNSFGRVPFMTVGIMGLIAFAVARDERENPSGSAGEPAAPPSEVGGWKSE